ncbi:MAG TPA: hypothetical protein ENJ12_08620 [Thiolapillus brandeum]|uniref:Peptidase C1A papain C-terminal domain-containing protein n=1 Tax=Thiolapillus brandeum TaxID=1076588 RepID=A0A831RX96_9GAMM|nr:hypothetical protein [Thiolapillus brandeum]
MRFWEAEIRLPLFQEKPMKKYSGHCSRRNARCLWRQIAVFCCLLLHSVTGLAIENYPTGLTEPSEAEKAWMEEHVIKVDPKTILSQSTAEALPSRVVNIEFLPKVGRQVWGACAAWASTYYYKTWQEAKEHGWHRPDPAVDPEHIMSPAFTFNLYNGGHDLASNPTAKSEALAEAPLPQSSIPVEFGYLTIYGAAPISKMDANLHPGILPNADQFYSAFPYRAQDVYELDYTTDTGMEALKTHLASGDLATMSLILYDNFSDYPADQPGIDNEVFFANGGSKYDSWCDNPPCRAGHALTVIGYDDDKTYIGTDGQQHSGAMLLVNSWGTGWGSYLPEAGESGFVWMGYDYFKTQTDGIANYMTDRINYKPTLVGLLSTIFY